MQPEVERELIRKCQAGDSRFYEPLVRAYEPVGLRLALGMLGNGDDARDALQDAFVKAYETIGRFDARRPFGPWFLQILRNQCRDLLRSRASRVRLEGPPEAVARQPAPRETGPERRREVSAARELLRAGLSRIGPEHREILILKELEGFRYGEIASILEIPEGTVASRLFHARRALRDALQADGAHFLNGRTPE